MKKKIIITLGILALIIAIVVGIFIWKNISEKPAETVHQTEIEPEVITQQQPESSPAPEAPVLAGGFVDGDAIHSGTGTARISLTDQGPVLTFGEDFKVTNGPDLFVYLSPNAPGEGLGEFASLGTLKSPSGAQAYNAPANYADYKTVVIWCRAFSVTFATAELTRQ